MNWGRLIKELRAETGISQRKLASKSSVSRSTLARLERGSTHGFVTDVEKLLAALGYELDVMPALKVSKGKDRSHGEAEPGRSALH